MSMKIIDLSIFERIAELEKKLKEVKERDRLKNIHKIYPMKSPELGLRIYDNDGNLIIEYKQVGFIGRDE